MLDSSAFMNLYFYATDDKDLINTKATSRQGDFVVIASLDSTANWSVTSVRGVFAKES